MNTLHENNAMDGIKSVQINTSQVCVCVVKLIMLTSG